MLDSFFGDFLAIAVVALLGAMSPGPDFVIVTKNSLAYSRRGGLFTALGVALGVCLHLTYCLIGVGVVISESPFLFRFVKYAGALYLVFIGFKSLFARPSLVQGNLQQNERLISSFQAFKAGLLTNALNPKATLFFLSVFSQVVDPETPFYIQALFALEVVLITLAWFSLLALLLSHPRIISSFSRFQHRFEQGMGLLLVAFGLKIAFY